MWKTPTSLKPTYRFQSLRRLHGQWVHPALQARTWRDFDHVWRVNPDVQAEYKGHCSGFQALLLAPLGHNALRLRRLPLLILLCIVAQLRGDREDVLNMQRRSDGIAAASGPRRRPFCISAQLRRLGSACSFRRAVHQPPGRQLGCAAQAVTQPALNKVHGCSKRGRPC